MKQKLLAIFVSPIARVALPLIIIAIGMAMTAASVSVQDTTYNAKARLWIPSKGYVFTRDGEVTSPNDSPLTSGPNALKTACEIIHSDAVTKLAYEELKNKVGDKCPDSGSIQAGVRAKPVELTDIVEIEYTGSTPELAVAGLQAVLDAFYHENNIQTTGPLQQSKIRLQQQLKLAQGEYSKVKSKVKQFQDSTSSVDLEADSKILVEEKSSLEHAIAENEHELKSTKSKLEFAQKQLGFGPESIVAVSRLTDDEIMKGLRISIAESEVGLIQLRSKYQDEHPKVKRLKASLEEAKKGLQERYKTLVGTANFKESLAGLGGENAQSRMVEDMAESSTELASVQAKLESLRESLAKVKSKLATVPAQQMQLADIHRTDELATNSLTAIERELQKIRLAETVTTNDSAIQVIDEPKLSGGSAPKSWTLGAALSASLALAMAGLQFMLIPKRVTSSRLAALLPIRTVGFVPKLEKDHSNSTALIAAMDRMRLALLDWFGNNGWLPIIVTSAGAGDGKSTIAFALSACFADAGKNVLLIDADTQHPNIHRLSKISASPGILQYLQDPSVNSLDVIVAVRENLSVIPAGGVTDEPHIIKHPRFTRLIQELGRNFDLIIIDSTECGDGIDCLATPQFASRLLAIVKLGHTLVHPLRNLSTQFDMLPSMETALVVTNVKQKDIKQLRQPTAQIAVKQESNSPISLESETANW